MILKSSREIVQKCSEDRWNSFRCKDVFRERFAELFHKRFLKWKPFEQFCKITWNTQVLKYSWNFLKIAHYNDVFARLLQNFGKGFWNFFQHFPKCFVDFETNRKCFDNYFLNAAWNISENIRLNVSSFIIQIFCMDSIFWRFQELLKNVRKISWTSSWNISSK